MNPEVKEQTESAPDSRPTFGLGELVLYFLRLGSPGFGLIALAGHMQKDLVEDRHWFSREDYLEGLAFSPTLSWALSRTISNVSRMASCRLARDDRRRHRTIKFTHS